MENAAIPDRHHDSMGNDQIRTVNLIKSAVLAIQRCCWGGAGILLSINPETVCFFSPRILPLKIYEVSRGGDDSEVPCLKDLPHGWVVNIVTILSR
ncbi:hypothetical protein [Escherichia coli]|uniref:hypothetical protein n=1 Tax=Escherichia coli TaxID=562 RepID=UPI00207743AD|nr:hypothetical protein [Escherichia coli]